MSAAPLGGFISGRGRKLLLLAVAASLLGGVTQCRMVTDAVVRPQVGSAKAGDCMKACAHVANEAIRVESELHKQNVKACGSDATCLAAEDARHDAAVAAIQAQRKTCQNNCHHQGGGTGGR